MGLLGCADLVDTSLALVIELGSTDITVGGGQVTGSFDVTYRVGEFAEMGESFNPQDVQLYVDGDPIAILPVTPPPGFVAMLAPGDSRTVTLTGSAAAAEADRLCEGTVDVVITYVEGTSRETRLFEGTTEEVTCM